MTNEQLYIDNVYVPLTGSLNPSITKSVKDISEPDKAKAGYSKSVLIPRSKEADRVFSALFEFNITDHTFNVEAKAPCKYIVDSIPIIDGYLVLNDIVELDNYDIAYECVMYDGVANFFAQINGAYLTDLYESTASYEGLDIYDHPLTKELQQLSWDTQILENGGLVSFAFGKGYVYPLIDFGFSQDATNFIFTQMAPSIYEKEYMTRIINWAGFTVKAGGFLDTDDVIDHLIIPQSPECYQLTQSDITNREFVANTPELTSTGTTQSNNLPNGSLSSPDVIIFTNDSVAPGTDPGLNYNPATGEFTCVSTGVYDFNVLIDINATFTPTLGGSLKTICDIHGYIMFFHTPFATGVPVQVDALPFYITKDDSSFYSGARSTSSTPTYPDSDYMSGKAWGQSIQQAPIARSANPPDRYLLSMTGVPIQTGDIITVQWKAGIYSEALSPFPIPYVSSNYMFIDSFGAKSTGTAYLTMAVGAFYNKASNQTMSEGNLLQMSDVIPKQIKMIDYFMANVKRFNLVVDVSKDNPTELIIETWDNYFTGETLNIHELIDHSKDITSTPMGALDAKQYLYTYKPDSDFYNQLYTKNHARVYGDRYVEVESEFANAQKKTELLFSPTPCVGLPQNNRVLPTIYAQDGYGLPKSTKFNIRSLYYAGLKPCLNGWNHINYVSVFGIPFVETFVEYPYAGHFDDPFSPTFDLNFGLVEEVFYDDNIDPIIITDNNVTNKYHGKMLREITDPESRIVKAYVHLTPVMYDRFTFDKTYYWNLSYFRLLSKQEYNPNGEESTLCTFLKVGRVGNFTSTIATATGVPSVITPDTGGGGNVNMTERVPTKGNRSMDQPDNNNYSSRSVDVKGYNNYISGKAKNIEVYGDSNRIFAEANNIKIQGSDNTIDAGVSNVTLINTNGLHITESNVTYVNGTQIIGQGSGVLHISASQNADDSTMTYIADSSGANVILTFDVTTTEFKEGQVFVFKNVAFSPLYFCRVAITGGTIDGAATYNLAAAYDSITFQHSNGNFYVI